MRLIDLSQVVNNKTMPYPGDVPTSLERYLTLEKDGCTVYEYKTCLHTGTHVDAPMHMRDDKRFINEFALELFWGDGVLFDVCGKDPITLADVDIQRVHKDDVVLLYTGFDAHFGTEDYFTRHPSIDIELARALVDKGVKMVGMDMCSPDHEPNEIHKTLMPDVIILESLTNLKALIGIDSFTIMALPLKIEAEASQVRAVAMVR
jgi:Predicted metal-dependent hydrolase